jgi:hypothetical protein
LLQILILNDVVCPLEIRSLFILSNSGGTVNPDSRTGQWEELWEDGLIVLADLLYHERQRRANIRSYKDWNYH